MEAGLDLLLALLRNAKDYTEGVHRLFPRIPEMLEGDFDHLKQASALNWQDRPRMDGCCGCFVALK